jgi:hypothetical protein
MEYSCISLIFCNLLECLSVYQANTDDWQEMHGKSNRARPREDEKPEHAATATDTAQVEEPVTAEAADE